MHSFVYVSRQPGQGTVAEQRGRDYRKELEERERTAREKRERGGHTVGRALSRDLSICHLDGYKLKWMSRWYTLE